MSEDERDDAESDWLLEPPESGEIHVNIAIGSEVELSPEALGAIETLMGSLQESEVSGFALGLGDDDFAAACSTYRICNPYGACQPLTRKPCYSYVHCRIGSVA